MKVIRLVIIAITLFLVSCAPKDKGNSKRVITVSIPPFGYFVRAVADSDFVVNVMLPPGADHHSWEPLPGQITGLAGSEAFIIDGKLGFEYAWMNRFREVNPTMKILDLSEKINLIEPEEGEAHEGHNHALEGADPHYWLSPGEALNIASSVRDFIIQINPEDSVRYDANYMKLIARINNIDSLVTVMLSGKAGSGFMIYHPALSYFARDYGLRQISFENEGKDPSPSRMKELIDITRSEGIKVIFVQAEYDAKGGKVLAGETGAKLVVINPLNPDWEFSVMEIAKALSAN